MPPRTLRHLYDLVYGLSKIKRVRYDDMVAVALIKDNRIHLLPLNIGGQQMFDDRVG